MKPNSNMIGKALLSYGLGNKLFDHERFPNVLLAVEKEEDESSFKMKMVNLKQGAIIKGFATDVGKIRDLTEEEKRETMRIIFNKSPGLVNP